MTTLEMGSWSNYFYSNDKKHCVKIRLKDDSVECLYNKLYDFLAEYISKTIMNNSTNNKVLDYKNNLFYSENDKEYFILHKGTRIIILKSTDGNPSNTTSIFSVYSSKIDVLVDFIDFLKTFKKEEINKLPDNNTNSCIKFYYLTLQRFLHLKSYETEDKPEKPILDKDTLNKLCEDVDNFDLSKQKYISKHKNYKRTYLFEGLPGTGKTSLIKFLSLKYNRHVYIINLDSYSNIDQLITSIANVRTNSIVVFEDFACKDEEQAYREKNTKHIPKKDFINFLDGMLSPFNGQLIIMTTNYVENIDPVLIRPGRIDYRINFTYATREQIDMYLKQESLEFPEKIISKYVGKATIAEIIYKIETNTFV